MYWSSMSCSSMLAARTSGSAPSFFLSGTLRARIKLIAFSSVSLRTDSRLCRRIAEPRPLNACTFCSPPTYEPDFFLAAVTLVAASDSCLSMLPSSRTNDSKGLLYRSFLYLTSLAASAVSPRSRASCSAAPSARTCTLFSALYKS